MRGLLALCMGLTLASCTNEERRNPLPINLPGNPFGGKEAPPPPRLVAAVEAGAPALAVSFPDRGVATILFRETVRDGQTTWLSVDGTTVITRNGFVHGTRGLTVGLMSADTSQAEALILSGQGGVADRFHSYLTANDTTDTLTFRCVIENRGPATLTQTNGTVASALLMAEACKSLEYEFTNFYWVSPTGGGIQRSQQWSGPVLGNLETQVVTR